MSEGPKRGDTAFGNAAYRCILTGMLHRFRQLVLSEPCLQKKFVLSSKIMVMQIEKIIVMRPRLDRWTGQSRSYGGVVG